MANEEASVLPPKNNYQTDRQGNGTTQRMPGPLHVESNFEGLAQGSAAMAEQTFNGDVEAKASQVAALHMNNAIASLKGQTALLGKLEKTKSPFIQRQLLKVAGYGEADQDRFLADLNPRDQRRQIAADGSSGAQGDQSHRG